MEPAGLPKAPEFMAYAPDFNLLNGLAAESEKYKNILVIAHGGSISTFYGYYHALNYQAKKKAYFLSTVDPDYIFQLKRELKKDETLVIAISKSGETITQIEALMQFVDYPLLIITGKSSSLRAIGEKLHARLVMHPPIGGRFTGLTEVALLPAAICGIEVGEIYKVLF